MSVGNHTHKFIDFLRSPRPQGERRKSIYSPWGMGKKIYFQAILTFMFMITDSQFKLITNAKQKSFTLRTFLDVYLFFLIV
jgi:hypothetical protein